MIGNIQSLKLKNVEVNNTGGDQAVSAVISHNVFYISRSQVEDLKREITSAERDFRAQISANEKKAHENWVRLLLD